jgi:hypothetical protein
MKARLAILSTHHHLVEYVRFALPNNKIRVILTNDCDIQIVFDSGEGLTFQILESLGHHPKRIIFTQNACAEYCYDLMQFAPQVMVCLPTSKDIVAALETIKAGQTHFRFPQYRAELTPQEQKILRLIAQGEDDKYIATTFTKMSVGRIRNIFNEKIKPKIQAKNPNIKLETRIQISRYYYGAAAAIRYEQYRKESSPTPEMLAVQASQKEAELQQAMKNLGFAPHQREEAIKFFEKIQETIDQASQQWWDNDEED